MLTFYSILTLTICFFAACKGHSNSGNQLLTFVDTTKPFKKEIAKYEDGSLSIFYSLAKAKQQQLGLDNIENGFENLQIRIWYDFALVREKKLVIITNRDTSWTATVYDLQVDWDGHTETILSKNLKQMTPRSGWANFSRKLLDLKIVTLPNQNDIPGYYQGTDGESYN